MKCLPKFIQRRLERREKVSKVKCCDNCKHGEEAGDMYCRINKTAERISRIRYWFYGCECFEKEQEK